MPDSNEFYKPILRRCISHTVVKTPDCFPRKEDGYFTYPNTTYWSSDSWKKCKISLVNGFKIAKLCLDISVDADNTYMKKICDDAGEEWINLEKKDGMLIEESSGILQILLTNGSQKSKIRITPFLDKGRLAVEINRWSGCSVLMHKWMKHVLKFNKLVRRE